MHACTVLQHEPMARQHEPTEYSMLCILSAQGLHVLLPEAHISRQRQRVSYLPAFDAMLIMRSSSCSIHSRTSSSPSSVLRSAGVRAAAMAWARASASAHTARVALRGTDMTGVCV